MPTSQRQSAELDDPKKIVVLEMWQALQVTAPLQSVYFPMAHRSHLLLALLSTWKPAVQFSHVDKAVVSANLPGAHDKHSANPLCEKKPFSHRKQLQLPDLFVYLPGSHDSHCPPNLPGPHLLHTGSFSEASNPSGHEHDNPPD